MTRKKTWTRNKAWISLRKNHLELYPECRICDSVNKSNHVHHLIYRGKRGESEKPGDLVTLCAKHHNSLHKNQTGNLKKWTLQFIKEETLKLSYLYEGDL